MKGKNPSLSLSLSLYVSPLAERKDKRMLLVYTFFILYSPHSSVEKIFKKNSVGWTWKLMNFSFFFCCFTFFLIPRFQKIFNSGCVCSSKKKMKIIIFIHFFRTSAAVAAAFIHYISYQFNVLIYVLCWRLRNEKEMNTKNISVLYA